MFSLKDEDIKELEADLKTFHARAFPFATKATLNTAVFKGQKLARKDVRVKMIQRNRFTEQSIQVKQSRTLKVSRQAAFLGSTADYMETQEFGGVEHSTGKHGVSLPTSYSAGQGEQEPRTKLPRKGNKLENIKLKKRLRKANNKKQSTLFKIQDAVTSGKRFVFLDLGRTKGIFRVVGGRKNFKRGWPVGAKLRMVHDLSHDSVTIPRNPWLKPVVDRMQVLIPDIYKDKLTFQARRLGLFN